METEENFSSNSSIDQRKGRLGRTCPGEYHYFVYHSHDFTHNRQHDKTELEKVDMTNFIFELLLRKNSNFQKSTFLLAKLNQ
jgi:HrpA-like RNA helicase